jgi:hypothetical protein
MVLAANTLYVFNAGPGTVVALDLDGHQRWRYAPPDSLRFNSDRVVALAAGTDGGVWAADPNSRRCTILSPLGTIERVVRIGDSPHLAPRSDGSFWKASYLGIAPVLFDVRGHRVRTLRLPPSLAAPPDAVGDALLGLAGDTLVVAYREAGRFLIAGPHGAPRDVRAIEPRGFSRFQRSDVTVGGRTVQAFKTGPGGEPATLGLATDAGIFYALYWSDRGPPDDKRRIVDKYRVATGAYLGSWRLPLPASAIAVRGDVVYALTDSGDLHIWHWVSSADTPSR